MRRAEVIALKWQDIDWEAGIIRVRHAKGDKYREVAMVAGEDEPADARKRRGKMKTSY